MKGNILKINILTFFYYTHFIAAVLVPFFTTWGGLPFSQILFLNAAFMFYIFILEIPTGTVADYFGQKTSMFLSVISGIIAIFVYTSYPSFAIFLIGEFFWALSYALMSGSKEALVYNTLKYEKQESLSKSTFARIESFKLAGILLGAIAGGGIAKLYGLKAPVYGMLLPLLLTLFIIITLKEPTFDKKSPKPPFFTLLKSGIHFFAKQPILRLLTIDMVLVASICQLIIWFYQVLLQKLSLDIKYFGLIHAGMCIAQIISVNSFKHFENLFKKKKIILTLTTFVTGGGFILLGLSQCLTLSIILIILVAGMGLSRRTLFMTYLNRFIPDEKRATVLSVSSMFNTFAIFIINIGTGFLSNWSIQNTLIVMGTILILITFLSPIREEHLID